jgi:ribose/xylose/arabinose/galactoside ABC-type transport system permease subunit
MKANKNGRKKGFRLTYNMALLIIAVAMYLVIGIINSTFFQFSYGIETIVTVIEIAIMALPTTLVIITGGIDFSMSSILVLSAYAAALWQTASLRSWDSLWRWRPVRYADCSTA